MTVVNLSVGGWWASSISFFLSECWEMVILLLVLRVRPGVAGYLLSSRNRNAHSFAAKRQKRNSENKNLGRLLHKLSVTLIDFYSTGAM